MEPLLDTATRMAVAWNEVGGPRVAPAPYWWDGRYVWFSAPRDREGPASLEPDQHCAVYVAAPGDPAAERGGEGVLVRGTARVFAPEDVMGTLPRLPRVATARGALALKHARSLVGQVLDAVPSPARLLRMAGMVTVGVLADSVEPVVEPDIEPGIAPALPTTLPPEVRRLLAGRRRIVLATSIDEGLGLVPAVWGAGFHLDLPGGGQMPERTPVQAFAELDTGWRPSQAAGMVMTGRTEGARLVPTQVRWWHGNDHGAAEIPTTPFDPVVLPD